MIRQCISTTHKTPVEATVLGVFGHAGTGRPPQAVRYCAECAKTAWDLGLFAPKGECHDERG